MDFDALNNPAACVEEALHFFATSNTAWETANNYSVASKSSRPTHRNEISDPGVRLHSSQPLPSSLTSLFSDVKYNSFMGLFPEINRAWLSVDSNLFLWAYTPFGNASATSDFYVYEGFSQIIVSVALVAPRPGVFVDAVRHLIVVATPVEVTLLAVAFSSSGQLSLIPTHISIPTDNIMMLKILSAPDGRIFMAGADGDLHEFVYAQQQRSPFFDIIAGRPRKKARKVSHSSSSLTSYFLPTAVRSWIRTQHELVDLAAYGNSLFTLSQAGVLSVYDLSNDSVRLVATSNIASDAKHYFSFAISPTEREFVSIHTVDSQSSSSVQLIVVTSLAERIYFTTQSTSNSSFSSSDKPSILVCVGFRPGPHSEVSNMSSRVCVHVAWCHAGAAVFADLKDNQSDTLISVFPESNMSQLTASRSDSSQNSHATEVVMTTSLDASVDSSQFAPHLGSSHFDTEGVSTQTPLRTFAIAGVDESLVRDHYRVSVVQPPIFFWILTSNSIQLYERVSPLDELQNILASSREDSSHIHSFFERYGSADACSMCIEIAISNPSLTYAAAHCYYTYGMSAALNQGLKYSQWSRRRNGADADDGSPQNDDGMFDVGRAALRATAFSRSSGAHDGLVLYLAGIMCSVWSNYVTESRNADSVLDLFTSKEKLIEVREELLKVVHFLEKFPPDSSISNINALEDNNFAEGNTRSNSDAEYIGSGNTGRDSERFRDGHYDGKIAGEAKLHERNAINGLKNLSIRACEALALLLVVSDHQLHRLSLTMPFECRRRLIDTRFFELVSTANGAVVASSLIEAIFSTYSDSGAAMTSVGRMLQERCPSYFGDRDVDLHRGLAWIRQAAEVMSGSYANVAGHTEIEGGTARNHADNSDVWTASISKAEEGVKILKTVPGRIFDVQVVFKDLKLLNCIPLLVDLGVCIGMDAEKTGKTERAQEVYGFIIDALSPLFVGGKEVDENLREASVHVALGAKSEVFLQRLYEFLRNSRPGEEALMAYCSESIETYLIDMKYWGVLWKYYARHNRNYEAGTVLLKLSETGDGTLAERMEHLSNALLNAKSASSKGDERAVGLLAEVGDFLDVGRVQMRVKEEMEKLESLQSTARENERDYDLKELREALKRLDRELMSLSTLFNKYARRYNLLEGCLECLRCGSYREDGFVRQIWIDIVEREMESCGGNKSTLRDKLEDIGREFYPSEVVFPITLILDVFQRYVVYEHSEVIAVNWAIELLQAVGVATGEILEGFRRLIEGGIGVQSVLGVGAGERELKWSDEGAQMHLIEAAASAVSNWVRSEETKEMGRREKVEGIDCEAAMRTVQAAKSRVRGMGRSNCAELWDRLEDLERRVSALRV